MHSRLCIMSSVCGTEAVFVCMAAGSSRCVFYLCVCVFVGGNAGERVGDAQKAFICRNGNC